MEELATDKRDERERKNLFYRRCCLGAQWRGRFQLRQLGWRLARKWRKGALIATHDLMIIVTSVWRTKWQENKCALTVRWCIVSVPSARVALCRARCTGSRAHALTLLSAGAWHHRRLPRALAPCPTAPSASPPDIHISPRLRRLTWRL